MKKNKFMEFLNSKGQFAAVFAFIVVAGICAGAAAINNGNKTVDTEKNNTVTEPVLTNKNNKANKTEKIETPVKELEKTTDENEHVLNTENNVAEIEANDEFEIVLSWPVEGEILLGYSPDKLVYDPTLDQYRTNDSICIAAEVGSEVEAAADGTVAEVREDETVGNYVVIEHKNGWATTYSQLTDIKVSEGETVSKGDVIGVVSKPSVYSTALDSHMEFTVTLDDMTVDPEIAIG